MSKDSAFSKWIITCKTHGGSCPDKVTPNLKFKETALPTVFREKPAFYFKYNRGLKFESIKRHYPEDHFEVTPLPGRLKVMQLKGVYYVDEEGLDLIGPERLVKASKMQKNEVDDETEADENPGESSIGEKIHEIALHKELNDEAAEDYEPKNSKKLKIVPKTEVVVPDHREGGVNVQQDNEVKLKLGVPKLNFKSNNIKPPLKKTYADVMSGKPKTKPRECKKLPKQKDRESQRDQALKHLYDWKEFVDKSLNSLQEGQKKICTEMVDWAKKTVEFQESQDIRIGAMQEDLAKLKQRIVPISERVQKPSIENQGKALPELEKF